MLLPIKMALSILCILSVIVSTRLARLLPASAKVRIRIRLAVVKAVSAEEKNADKHSRTTRKINWAIDAEFKKIYLNFL